MFVWLPGRSLLYTSDLFSPDGNGGWFTPQYLDEALSAYARNGVRATTVWGMHYSPTPYTTLERALHAFVNATPTPAPSPGGSSPAP